MPADSGPAGPVPGPRRGCIGCLTALLGTVSGSMVGVLIGVVMQAVTNAPRCEGVPSCNWNRYAAVGALVGLATLPILTLWRLRRPSAGARSSDRG